MAKRRGMHEGGLSRKTGYYTDADGERIPYTYWQASREVPADKLPPGVTRQRVTGSGPTRAAAVKRLQENWDALPDRKSKRGKTRLSGKATVRTLFEEWDRANKAGQVSSTMAWKYESYFTNHVLPHIGERSVDSLTELDLLTLFNVTLPAKTDAQGKPLLGGPARRNIYMALSGCLKFAVRQQYIAASPLEGVKPPAKAKPKDPIDQVLADGRTLLAAIQADGFDVSDRARWLLAFLGLRRGERLGLSWANVRDLDGDEPKIVINQQLAWDKTQDETPGLHVKPVTKTGKPRTIPLTEPWVSALKAHRERWLAMTSQPGWAPRKPEYADLLFLRESGNVIDLNSDNRDFRELQASLGISSWRPHLMRHVTAVLLAELGDVPIGVVMAILGHESEAMTVYYAHTDDVRVRAPLQAFGESLTAAAATATTGAKPTSKPKPKPKASAGTRSSSGRTSSTPEAPATVTDLASRRRPVRRRGPGSG